ncbi:MAG TPA: hypothetical protein VKA95_15095 [Nitrososphaeraceae archaeon]|nr:hypothetical protein [Nitrososphaeraceae archaeon]
MKSIATQGSFPTTQALCPDGIITDSPGPDSASLLSSSHFNFHPSGDHIHGIRSLTAICFGY